MASARLIAALSGAGSTVMIDRALSAAGLTDSAALTRSNFRGRPVSLVGGASVAVGALVGAASIPGRWRVAVLVSGGSAAIAGAYDDLVAPRTESGQDKGGRGHLRALRAGRISGGAVKVALIGAGALVAAGTVSRTPREILPDAAVIALMANLVNLFDLRPGRALKITLAVAGGLLGGPTGAVTAGAAGAALAGLPGDLGETRMLGDLGANTLGALLGLRLLAAGPVVRYGALVGALTLTVASERVSFSRLIEASPVLDRIDRLGRATGSAGR